MKANEFLQLLSSALRSKAGVRPTDGSAASWTLFMTDVLLAVARDSKLHLCSHTLGKLHPPVAPEDHQPREWLFDFSLYREWSDWSLPDVIIEHENHWSKEAFLVDMFKLMMGYAPLRVMFAYATGQGGVADYVRELGSAAQQWVERYPPISDDLVLIGHGSMDLDAWRVLHRNAGAGAWDDLGVGLQHATKQIGA